MRQALPRQGAAPSFESLAQEITRDVHPRSLLDELCRLGLATWDEAGDTVALSREAFVRLVNWLVLASGIDPTRALVLSQVGLSFGIPFALIPLIRLTSDNTVMGADVNRRLTTVLGWLVTALVTVLNIALIFLTLGTHPG